jgi:Tol biopolymer transport system component
VGIESLHLLRSGIDANDSGIVVFSSKSKDADVVYLYDLNEDRVTRRYKFDELIEARSPRLSPDGQQIVFSGVRKSGFTNLYVLDLPTGDYVAIIDDVYHDTDPVFTTDGRRVVFSSNRSAHGDDGALNLFEIDLDSRRIEQLTFGNYDDQAPECADWGVYFSSNRTGTYNLFLNGYTSECRTGGTTSFVGSFLMASAPDRSEV